MITCRILYFIFFVQIAQNSDTKIVWSTRLQCHNVRHFPRFRGKFAGEYPDPSVLRIRGGLDSNVVSEGQEEVAKQAVDAFALGSNIGSDVDLDQVKKMTLSDLKDLFAKHGISNLDDEKASKILAAAQSDVMVSDPSSVRDDPDVNSWTGRREDYITNASQTPQTKLAPLRRGFLTSPSPGARKASIGHHQSPTSPVASPVASSPRQSPGLSVAHSKDPDGVRSSTRRSRVARRKASQDDFDLAELEQLNQKLSEIQLKDAFAPEVVVYRFPEIASFLFL